eukprot:TRINITY_DN27132_c0_g2_i1.p1 TRINITY_DN27132_c0_g2~~TRINITY_DN27132_c0_g2_i1.p1  ORF type:complete len:314 (+),score=27.37 TRINITY_DN27132_c0_g2_i1:60-1001(+)
MDLMHRLSALLILCGGATCMIAAYGLLNSVSAKAPLRSASVLAFLLNVYFVSLPGRFDGDPDTALRMPTLLAPAPWAFAIWAVIYIGELFGLVWICVCARKCEPELIAKSTVAWCAANVAQSLWCCAFRPWAKDALWLSAILLGATAACLFPAQAGMKQVRDRGTYWAVVFPRSLHLGWTTAATLVNLNSYVSIVCGPIVAMTCAIGSVVLALYVGIVFCSHGLPSATGAIAWALWALGTGRPSGDNVAKLGQGAMRMLHQSELMASVLLCIAILGFGIHSVKDRREKRGGGRGGGGGLHQGLLTSTERSMGG